MILYGSRYGLITFLSIQISMRLESERNSLIIESRSRENLNASNAHSDKAKSRRSTVYSCPSARLSNQSATNEQHELACKTTRRGVPARSPRRNPSPYKSTNRSTLGSHESSHSRAESRREAQFYRQQLGKKRVWRTRKREDCTAGGVDGEKRPSSVTESTIKRHFRSGNSRYLKLRSQISNAENRC